MQNIASDIFCPFLGGNVRRTKGVELESCQAVPVPTTYHISAPYTEKTNNSFTSSADGDFIVVGNVI